MSDAEVTRSLRLRSVISRLPTTTASATVYTSSSCRGAWRHSSLTSWASWCCVMYQTFHSSKEMLIFLFERFLYPTWSAVATTVSMK